MPGWEVQDTKGHLTQNYKIKEMDGEHLSC